MTSHELARALLSLQDVPVRFERFSEVLECPHYPPVKSVAPVLSEYFPSHGIFICLSTGEKPQEAQLDATIHETA